MIRHLATTVLALLISLPVFAQSSAAPKEKPAENTDILLAKVQADKKLLVANNMGLTETEAKGFWPVYESYQKDLAGINQRMVDTVQSFADAFARGPVSDDAAKKLMDQYLAVEQEELNIKKTYRDKLAGIIPPSKIARYLQIETKIRSAIKWDLAKNIPLVQ